MRFCCFLVYWYRIHSYKLLICQFQDVDWSSSGSVDIEHNTGFLLVSKSM